MATTKPKEFCEVVLWGKMVDVSGWMHKHPGGAKILRIFHHRDATEAFVAYHSDQAVEIAKKMAKAGKDVPSHTADPNKSSVIPLLTEREGDKLIKPNPQVVAAFEECRQKCIEKGLFKASFVDEVSKLMIAYTLYFAGIYFLRGFSFWEHLIGFFLYTVAVQQYGWLSHDYSHHSVFKNCPALNDFFPIIFGFQQCYDVMWWKARHNTHHVCTNEMRNDPDIKTSPLLTYLNKLKRTYEDIIEPSGPKDSSKLNKVQRLQHLYFLPALGLLHIYWALETLQYLASRPSKYWWRVIIWFLGCAAVYWIFLNAGFWWFCIFSFWKGVATGSIVFATHYGEDRLTADHEFSLAEQTAFTSRNIAGGPLNWIHWFSGGICWQIEHHLFPMMPRNNLPKATPLVKELFAKFNLPFHESSYWGCMQRNMMKLDVNRGVKDD